MIDILNRLRDPVITLALIGYIVSILELTGVLGKVGIARNTIMDIATLFITGILTVLGIMKQPNSTKEK